MNRILEKTQLAGEVFKMRIHAPLIAEERLPGQFIILQLDTDFGERVPLTIADADTDEGSVAPRICLPSGTPATPSRTCWGRWAAPLISRNSGVWSVSAEVSALRRCTPS